MSYVRYSPARAPAPAASGWDAWAAEYAGLGNSNPTYALGKELLHELVDAVSPPPGNRPAWVLDFHCGAGDDLTRLLARGWRVVGCDGSVGMLHAAAARCPADLSSGRLELWHDMARSVDAIRRVSACDAERWPAFCERMARAARLLARAVQARGITHLHAHFATAPATVARIAAAFADIGYSFTAHAKDIFHQSVREDELEACQRLLEALEGRATMLELLRASLEPQRLYVRVGRELQLDPLLIIAVISIESRFNPIAESVKGAKGLMQIIPKYHTEKLQEFGGVESVFDPETNIQVGAQILKEYIRTTGNVGIALQMYAGALSDYEDQYTNKVMNERHRLQQVVSQVLRRPPPPAARMRTASIRSTGYGSPLD